MRTIRALTIATAVVMVLPTIAAAQGGRQFRDSWFWGIKGGGFTFADSAQNTKNAPMGGVEWLITRSHGGLYISAGQAFFTTQTLTLHDPLAPQDSGFRAIDLKNLRKVDVALMAFPGDHIHFHPYAGAGLTLDEISSAVPRPPFGTPDQLAFADTVIQNQKVGFTPFFVAGAQWRLRWFSVFGQGTANPAQKSFLLYNGKPWNFTYEFGLRYNVGTSIDRS
ncbi:MAG TPA: hypothetical protein VN706_02860 [Gemmatimonadaceae bacterium]|nr:hypothetical protein [Gemmatimonadaceae bacterium]